MGKQGGGGGGEGAATGPSEPREGSDLGFYFCAFDFSFSQNYEFCPLNTQEL